MAQFLFWNIDMIMLFSKRDIAERAGIELDDTVDYLTLRLLTAGLKVAKNNFGIGVLTSFMLENSLSPKKTKIDIMLDHLSNTFQETEPFADIVEVGNDLIKVEII